MLSIFSSHFFNWTAQLKDSGHKVYWLDVNDSRTRVEKIDFVHQIIGWRYRYDYPGRYFIKNKFPRLNSFINKYNERELGQIFNIKMQEIKPDVVHSFAMHLSCFPIFEEMKKHQTTKWIYSSWGSDLYFYQDKKEFQKVRQILPFLDYMFADCKRDAEISRQNGFKGKQLGVFPGRGGYDFSSTNSYIRAAKSRKTIIVKGYQGKHGKCIEVLKALIKISSSLKEYSLIIFGADGKVIKFIAEFGVHNRFQSLEVFNKISNAEVMAFMGKSIISIGNSTSDGMPNTLLEAIVMEAFPIQSNPGGATAELIEHGKNGFLIENPEDSEEIAGLIVRALKTPQLLKSGIDFNTKHLKPKLEREYIRKQVLEKYRFIEENL